MSEFNGTRFLSVGFPFSLSSTIIGMHYGLPFKSFPLINIVILELSILLLNKTSAAASSLAIVIKSTKLCYLGLVNDGGSNLQSVSFFAAAISIEAP